MVQMVHIDILELQEYDGFIDMFPTSSVMHFFIFNITNITNKAAVLFEADVTILRREFFSNAILPTRQFKIEKKVTFMIENAKDYTCLIEIEFGQCCRSSFGSALVLRTHQRYIKLHGHFYSEVT